MVATASLAALRYAVIRGSDHTTLGDTHSPGRQQHLGFPSAVNDRRVHKLAGVTVRVTDAGGTNVVEIDMLVTADAIAEARD